MKYLIRVFLVTEDIIEVEVQYEKEYDLKRNITIMGNNGVTKEEDGHYTFYPPTQIKRIEVDEIKP